MASLDIKKNILDNLSQSGKGDGRSGAFMFYTYDKKLIIKSMKKDELLYMTNIV
jgi:hypothetical protein